MLAAQSRPAVSGLDSSNLAWGKHPIAPGGFPPYVHVLMINHKKKALTFDGLIAAVYAPAADKKPKGLCGSPSMRAWLGFEDTITL
jgi:hypothetical protein